MRVPEGAGKGKARITFSVPDWPDGKVAPATFDVPIEEAAKTSKTGMQPAVDLTTIDRTTAKEPVYKNKPKYCLLVFGPEAKFRVWLVQDGDVLYVDRNGNGDLTEKGEQWRPKQPQAEIAREGGYPSDYREWHVGDIVEPDGTTKHSGLEVSGSKAWFMVRVFAHGRHWYANGDHQGRLQFAHQPPDAPIVHFAGPLGACLFRPGPLGTYDRWIRGAAEDLYAALGTPGLGKGAFAAIGYDALYSRIEVFAEVDFPGRNAGAKRIKVKTALGRF